TLLLCLPLSTAGLTHVVGLTGGMITYVGYPVLIALTFCNILFKLCNFRSVKVPVLITFIASVISYYYLLVRAKMITNKSADRYDRLSFNVSDDYEVAS